MSLPVPVRAHQRRISVALALSDLRPIPASLTGFSVETISRTLARPLILRYEWLGSIGHSTYFVGLFSPEHELYGVACFGYGPSGQIRQLIGEPAVALERGACVHYAPRNSASFLITHSTKLLYRILGVARFFAYADPCAGEYGAVYQAANWLYLGQGLDGRNGRARRYFVLPPGSNPNDPSAWRTTRDLRRSGRRMTFAQARALGWQIGTREAKHVYATNVGADRRAWRKMLKTFPYPAPCPQLKRAA